LIAAPEILLNKRDADQRKADCWSVGVMLYQLLFGEHPFEKPSDLEEGSVKRSLHRILKVWAAFVAVWPFQSSLEGEGPTLHWER
jgi:serine/threonine protein kinase